MNAQGNKNILKSKFERKTFRVFLQAKLLVKDEPSFVCRRHPKMEYSNICEVADQIYRISQQSHFVSYFTPLNAFLCRQPHLTNVV